MEIKIGSEVKFKSIEDYNREYNICISKITRYTDKTDIYPFGDTYKEAKEVCENTVFKVRRYSGYDVILVSMCGKYRTNYVSIDCLKLHRRSNLRRRLKNVKD